MKKKIKEVPFTYDELILLHFSIIVRHLDSLDELLDSEKASFDLINHLFEHYIALTIKPECLDAFLNNAKNRITALTNSYLEEK